MDLKELMQFAREQSERIKRFYGSYPDNEKRILARTVKLNEEVGELCEQVMAYLSFQRKDKY